MNLNLSAMNRSQIGNEILAYLVDYPEAQDTLEGILEWWLLERTIKFETPRVREALADLSSKGFILEEKGADSQTRYRINPARYKIIQVLLDHNDG